MPSGRWRMFLWIGIAAVAVAAIVVVRVTGPTAGISAIRAAELTKTSSISGQIIGTGSNCLDDSDSGGASGANDFAEAARTAVINKRAGGMGLISGRKAFQRPMSDGVKLLNLIQDVYLDAGITVA